MTHSVFIKSRIVSSTALKLFSFGFRRRMMLNVSYMSWQTTRTVQQRASTQTHTYRHKHTWSFCLMDLLLSETAFINWYDASMRNTQRKRRENRLIQTHLEKMANDTMCDVRKMWVNGLTRNSATFQLVSQVVCSKQKREDKTNYDDDDLHLNRDHVNQFTYLIKSWQRHDKQCKVLSVLARDAPMSTGRLSVGR